METLTQARQVTTANTAKIAPPMVKPGAARMRELTPAQRRAVVLAQQQVMKARAAKKAKDEAEQMRRRMWHDEETAAQAAPRSEAKAAQRQEDTLSLRGAIGLVLRDLRSRDHKTLREVSEKAGVSLGYLSEVERGQKEASSELLSSIAEALGVSTAQLLRLVAFSTQSFSGVSFGRPHCRIGVQWGRCAGRFAMWEV